MNQATKVDTTVAAALVVRDEQGRLAQCLKSPDFADEVVVVDSASVNDTVASAERCMVPALRLC